MYKVTKSGYDVFNNNLNATIAQLQDINIYQEERLQKLYMDYGWLFKEELNPTDQTHLEQMEDLNSIVKHPKNNLEFIVATLFNIMVNLTIFEYVQLDDQLFYIEQEKFKDLNQYLKSYKDFDILLMNISNLVDLYIDVILDDLVKNKYIEKCEEE